MTGSSNITLFSAHHAFLYNGRTMQDLGTLGGTHSYSRDINDSGQVVGWSDDTSNNNRAFLYDGENMLDLCALVDCVSAGWEYLYEAWAINANGDITGYGRIDGQDHAFLVSVSSEPEPEPESLPPSVLFLLLGQSD